MPGLYAAGRKALASCDRCGFTYKLLKLKEEYDNRRRKKNLICPKCKDPDHPQNYVGETPLTDDRVVFEPKPDTGIVISRDGNSIVHLFKDGISGWVTIDSSIELLDGYMRHSWTNSSSLAIGNPTLFNFDTDTYKRVRARVRINDPHSLAGSWTGRLLWLSSTVGLGSQFSELPPISMGDEFNELSWDLSAEARWTGSITSLNFFLYESPATTGSIDWEWIKIEEKII